MLKATQPAPIDSLFTPGSSGAEEREAADAEWQQRLCRSLIEKKAVVSVRLNSGSGLRDHFLVKNRYFLSELIKGVTAGDGRLEDMVSDPLPPAAEEQEQEPEDAEPEDEQEEPATEPVEAPPPGPPPRPKRIDAGAVYDLLELVAQRVAVSIEYQSHMVEALVFVKDEIVAMRDHQIAMGKRLKSMEESAGAAGAAQPVRPDPELHGGLLALADGISGISKTVSSIQADVKGVLGSMTDGDASKFLKLAQSVGELQGTMKTLRDMAAAELSDE